jgi:hypothetical protein
LQPAAVAEFDDEPPRLKRHRQASRSATISVRVACTWRLQCFDHIGFGVTDLLRARPSTSRRYPFIEQDEWRIAILTEGYLNGDAQRPLEATVSPSLFRRYLFPTEGPPNP